MTELKMALPEGCNMDPEMPMTGSNIWEHLNPKPEGIEPIGVRMNGNVFYLMQEPIDRAGTIEWVDRRSNMGTHIYRQSILFMFLKAVHELFPERRVYIRHTISNAVYCEFDGMRPHEGDDTLIYDRMKEYVKKNLPIKMIHMKHDDTVALFEKQGHQDTADLIRETSGDYVDLVELDGYYEFFFFAVAGETGYLTEFHVWNYEDGFLLQTPEENEESPRPFKNQKHLQRMLLETTHWATVLKVTTVSELNAINNAGRMNDLILVSEALHDKKIANLADKICQDPQIQLIMIAGPSSSGKTSFAQRLMIHLRVNGKRPQTISMDNYFVSRSETPRDEKGNLDFENLDALHVDLFNDNVSRLLKGEEVQLPYFDFKEGVSHLDGPLMRLEPGQPLIIEGIHGLNPRLTESIPKERKRLIYISALTQLNLNLSNSILTTDCRLIRRIARDSRTRGHSAQDTIRQWPSVRRGEIKNIFHYQENADYYFNSELVYELTVLKPIVKPLLEEVPDDSPEFPEARRLLRMLYYIKPMGEFRIPYQSIMREFVGGSWFDVG